MRVRRVEQFIREKFFGRISGADGLLRSPVGGRTSCFSSHRQRHGSGEAGNYSRDRRRLAKYFGTSEQFWLNLQDAFAVHQVQEKLHKELRAINPLAAAAAR